MRTGLRPLGLGARLARIMRHEPEIDLIVLGRDRMLDCHAVFQDGLQLQDLVVRAERDQFCDVRDDRMLDPIGVGGIAAAECLQVVDFDPPARQMRTVQNQ